MHHHHQASALSSSVSLSSATGGVGHLRHLLRLLMLGIVGMALAGWWSVANPSVAMAAPTGEGQKPVLYLTFDDGPGEDTPAFLDLLATYDASSTFFVTGRAVAANPAVAVRIVEDGHAIANHTWSHPRLSGLSNAAIAEQFRSTTAVIESTTGVTPVCYRPPYGATNARVHAQAVAAGLPNDQWIAGGAGGNHFGLWDIDTNDWRLSRRGSGWSEAAMMRQLNRSRNGDTVLLHDGFSNRRRGLRVLAAWLEANHDRFEFRTLPGCGVPPVTEEPAVDPAAPEMWHRARIARLYRAYFDRTPDAEGFEFWTREHVTGLAMVDVADYFSESSEFTRSATLDDEAFVAFVYQNVLDRTPDAEGFAYWVSEMNAGMTRGELVIGFSDSREYIERSAPAVTEGCAAELVVDAYRCWVGGLPTYTW